MVLSYLVISSAGRCFSDRSREILSCHSLVANENQIRTCPTTGGFLRAFRKKHRNLVEMTTKYF
jgi:hypothetical protein